MSADSMVLVDAAGRRRSPATLPGYLAGRAPHNKGMQYPPDPPRPEEIIVVMRQAGHDRHGLRLRALIPVLWRAGLRISEALALNETDIDTARGSLLIRHGKGDLCRIRHRSPYVALRTMLRSLECGRRSHGIELAGATYFGQAERFRLAPAARLLAAAAGLRDSAPRCDRAHIA
jgi:integrase